MPAGKLEIGEEPITAVIREMYEETGYKADMASLAPFETFYVRYPDVDFVFHTFHHILSTRPVITIDQKESKDYRWVEPRQALELPLIPDEDACIREFCARRLQ